MESVLRNVERGNEEEIYTSLLSFNELNSTNFKLEDNAATREAFCSSILEQLSSRQWSPRLQASALTSLRIAARERDGVDKLRSEEGLKIIVKLADLSHDIKKSCFHSNTLSADLVQVIVEAVKCLCNLVLANQYLTTLCTELGVLHGLSLRLKLVRNVELPPDILTFDLRLLFLITACGVTERSKFREDYKGLNLLVNIIDSLIFGREFVAMEMHGDAAVTMETKQVDTTEQIDKRTESDSTQSSSVQNSVSMATNEGDHSGGENEAPTVPRDDKYSIPLPPLRCTTPISPSPLDDTTMRWVSEAMKVVFNQTVHWKEEKDFTKDDLDLLDRIVVLVRIILVSVPFQLSKIAMDTIIHSIEVLVNSPLISAHHLLLPAETQLMPTLQARYPDIYQGAAVARGDDGIRDETFEKWNMIVCTCLLDLLVHLLQSSSVSVSTLLTVLRSISKGHRVIRRFFKSKILPPLKEVTQRPEQEDSLKGRLVKLMTAAAGSGCGQGTEGVAAEFLFVLCKEDSARLIKYTGYGNAAGLLLSHGLLGGGKTTSATTDYSSDSSDSDTDDYVKSKPSIDPVTGGPSVSSENEGEGKEEMTEDEKEREAVKLVEMMKKLNEHGVIRVLPMDSQQQDILSEDLPLD